MINRNLAVSLPFVHILNTRLAQTFDSFLQRLAQFLVLTQKAGQFFSRFGFLVGSLHHVVEVVAVHCPKELLTTML